MATIHKIGSNGEVVAVNLREQNAPKGPKMVLKGGVLVKADSIGASEAASSDTKQSTTSKAEEKSFFTKCWEGLVSFLKSLFCCCPKKENQGTTQQATKPQETKQTATQPEKK